MAKIVIVSPADVIARWQILQVVDARSISDFRAGHIPGAVNMDWREYRSQDLSMRERLLGVSDGVVLFEPDEVSRKLSALPLRHDLPILVYGGTSRWGEEGRIAWNLLYWGAQDVLLLDGGWKAWVQARPDVTATTHPKQLFSVKLDHRRRAEYRDVTQVVKAKKKILDVRSSGEVASEGKIPSAESFSDSNLYRKDGLYPTQEELLALMPGISSAEVVYCAGGVRSALAALLIEARFGVIVKNYDGSMWDWERKNAK